MAMSMAPSTAKSQDWVDRLKYRIDTFLLAKTINNPVRWTSDGAFRKDMLDTISFYMSSSTSLILPANGGTGSDLSATGCLNCVVKQTSTGANFTVSALPFLSLSLKPTTVSGYGITDAASIVSTAFAVNKTGATTPVLTYTTASSGTYMVTGHINVNARSVNVVQMQVVWTDENSAVQTQYYSSTIATTGPALISPVTIYALTGTSITINVILAVGGGTIDYDVSSQVIKL